jgi:hypothetical protein
MAAIAPALAPNSRANALSGGNQPPPGSATGGVAAGPPTIAPAPDALSGSAGLFTPALAPQQTAPAQAAAPNSGTTSGSTGGAGGSVLFPGVGLGDMTPAQLSEAIGTITGSTSDALKQQLTGFLIRNGQG